MRRHDPSAAIFLMEIIVAIFFFSICAAICMNLFTGSRVIADRSGALNTAVVRASSTAEAYKASKGDMEALYNMLKKDESCKVSFDSERILMEYPEMQVEVIHSSDEYADITVFASGDLKDRKLYQKSDGKIFYLRVHI